MIMLLSDYFSWVLGALLVFWAYLSCLHLKNKISVLLNLEPDEDPSLRLMVGGYCFYHLGIIFLILFTLGMLIYQSSYIFSQPYLIALLIMAALTVPLADYLFSKAVGGEFTDMSRLMDLLRLFSYSLRQRKVKQRAVEARARVAPKYITDTNVSARTVRPTILYLQTLIGREKADELLVAMGMPPEYLEYHDSQMNVSFAMDLLQKAKEISANPRAAFYAQSCGGNLECMGSLFFFLSRWWSVKQCYKMFVKAASQMDTVMEYRIVSITDDSMLVRAIPRKPDEVPPHFRDGTYSVQGWFSAIPNLKGLPHALVEERQSIFEWPQGTPRPAYCEYYVKWVNNIHEGALLNASMFNKP